MDGAEARYRIDGELARGGMGVVYRAFDLVIGRPVAIKRPREVTAEHRERARRELLALRLLQFPGVVELLDAGEDADGRFFVTELIDGAPFPGAGHDLVALTAQVLDTLARVHAVGVLHRDLKPQNVLVDAAGRTHLLDFGIAHGAALGPHLTHTDALVGTPRYLAPEQLSGGAVDARTDLYSLGVMLFEALAGEAPFGNAGDGALYGRVWRDARPIAEVAPHTAPVLAALVDRLLARLPERRPASAAEALHHLGRSAPEPALWFVGRERERTELLEAARAGRRLGLHGDPGLGRTRLLAEVGETLAAEGRTVRRLGPGVRPLDSVRAAFGLPGGLDPAGCRAMVQANLAAGDVLLVDRVDGVDRWSLELVDAVDGVVLGRGPGPTLQPWTELDQRDLFWGPDKLLHLREDGARELHRRSGGSPARAAAVLGAWMEAGLARLEAGRVRLEPGAAVRLAELPPRPPLAEVVRLPDVPALRDGLRWVALGDGELEVAALARLAGLADWEAGLVVEELVDQRLADVDAAGRIVPRPGAEAALGLWTEQERRNAHHALAAVLPVGTRARLRHLVQGGDADEVAREARDVARPLTEAGRFAEACLVLETATAVVRWRVAPALESGLLRDWVLAAFPAEDMRLRELAAEGVRRSDVERLGVAELLDLADAAVALARRHHSVAEGLVADLPPLDDEGMEVMRATMVVEARTRPHPETADAELDRWADWAQGSEDRMGRWLGWRGIVAQARGDFAGAAGLAQRAVSCRRDLVGARTARVNLAMALLDSGELDAAAVVAEELLGAMCAARVSALEARAWWCLRSVAYRSGKVDAVDDDLIDAVLFQPPSSIGAAILFTEGMIAWRAGDLGRSATLVRAAQSSWGSAWAGRSMCTTFLSCLPGATHEPCVDPLAPSRRLLRQVQALADAKTVAAFSAPAILPRWEILAEAEIQPLETLRT